MKAPGLNWLTGFLGWQPFAANASHESTSKVWVIVLKLIMITPVACGAFATKSLYEFVRNHDELKQPPYHPRVELSLFLVYIGLVVNFGWSFVSPALYHKSKGSFILFIGLIDLGLSAVIAFGVKTQAEFLPASRSACSAAKAAQWQVQGDYKSFFTLAFDLGHADSPSASCRKFVSDWQLAAACLAFQVLISYVAVFYDERERSLLNPWRLPICIAIMIIFPIIMLDEMVFPRVRYAYRSSLKLLRKFRKPKQVDIELSGRYVPDYHHNGSNAKLLQVLYLEHALLAIVENLCYQDIVYFSLSSKAVREAIYPGNDLQYRVPKLKRNCCEAETRTHCIYCNKWICTTCITERFLPGMSGTRHVTKCKPYCGKCFYTSFKKFSLFRKRYCRCTSTDRKLIPQNMCMGCRSRNEAELQDMRHKIYQRQARDIAMGLNGHPAISLCEKCKEELKPGIRWWICGKCNLECRDAIHPPYVPKRKVDTEIGGGVDESTDTGKKPWWKALVGL
ncbi:hypothetical protein BU24DRAFT_425273 [Aaosphaeria arxii CBS 175.79]|uniref:Uncharacterized protein n=1 Tax=Aaosphaeria arxii CBS 175.79 TaxID=1450172 RepID=A0A6A5XHE1_9PLEO|nr:uncharacterized protein BU24DRAFT_425273 [Aaosphaeria arxii CBS 175.79]KAF2012638.1 hypothetical protein BU24DRAFT_425273 [Aaosphaeria arxii CBS 175.79]